MKVNSIRDSLPFRSKTPWASHSRPQVWRNAEKSKEYGIIQNFVNSCKTHEVQLLSCRQELYLLLCRNLNGSILLPIALHVTTRPFDCGFIMVLQSLGFDLGLVVWSWRQENSFEFPENSSRFWIQNFSLGIVFTTEKSSFSSSGSGSYDNDEKDDYAKANKDINSQFWALGSLLFFLRLFNFFLFRWNFFDWVLYLPLGWRWQLRRLVVSVIHVRIIW